MASALTLESRKWYSGMRTQEDWWSVWLGFLFFFLGLLSVFGVDLVGWVAYPSKWVGLDGLASSVKPLGAGYQPLGLVGSILATYLSFTIPTSLGAYFMGWDVKKFVQGWTCIFAFTYVVWIIGHHAFFAANVTNRVKYGLDFSLSRRRRQGRRRAR